MFNLFLSIKDYIDTYLIWPSIPSEVLGSYAILLFFAILIGLESHKPKRKWPSRSLHRSYRTNLSFFFFNNIVLSVFSVASIYTLTERWGGAGFLNDIASMPVQALLTFLLLDLMYYLWHKASHSFDWMWLFHKVHHSDDSLNITTAFRIHLVELLISCGLTAAVIFVSGANVTTVLMYEIIMVFFVMFHHTNISFMGEKFLSLVFVVPYLHRVHHSTERSEHDTNYGAVFSIWDRLFGTLKETDPETIGIKDPSPQTFTGLLMLWNNPTPSMQPCNTFNFSGTNIMISEAAYFKAEKRGFFPGNDLADWLEAEREITQHIYNTKTLKNQTRVEGGFFSKLTQNKYSNAI